MQYHTTTGRREAIVEHSSLHAVVKNCHFSGAVMAEKLKLGVNGSSVGRRGKCRSDLRGNVMWLKSPG